MIKTGRWYNPNAKIFYSEIQLWRIMNTSHDPSNEPILEPENQSKMVELHVTWQDRYEEGIVRPLTRAFVRDMASEYTTLEIMGRAKRVMEQSAAEQLNPKFAENDLILINFEITDVRQVGKWHPTIFK